MGLRLIRGRAGALETPSTRMKQPQKRVPNAHIGKSLKTPSSTAQRRPGLKAIAAVMPYLWPRDDTDMRSRVVLSVGILFLTAILNALLPVLFSIAIDRLTQTGTSLLVVAPVALLLGYGIIFWISRALNELRWILFGPLEQRVRRRLGLAVFDHLHTLSLRYHLSRRTGMLSRVQERGLEAQAELLFNLVFVIAPLVTEIVIITAVVLGRFEAHYAIIMAITLSLFLFAVIYGSEVLRRCFSEGAVRAAAAPRRYEGRFTREGRDEGGVCRGGRCRSHESSRCHPK